MRSLKRPKLSLRHLLHIAGLLSMLVIVAPLALQAQESASPPAAASAAEPPAAPSRSLLQTIRAGGIVMIPILVSSMLVTVFVFERALALRRDRVIPGPFIKRLMHQLREGNLDRDDARELCDESSSPIAEVLKAAFRKWGKPSVEVEQAILDEGERAAIDLRKYVRLFNAVATISPLLGLLGTVLGMITAFNDIASSAAMGRPELLAVGISEALITTASGLVVAIPALVLYLFFNSRVDSLVIEIDRIGKEVVNIISAEAIAERPARRRREAA
ncbi:MAG: MotA/TolQ/ExbB proton channel family protein [Planctomycetaceae bacterium]|nr:MotA/TolQ/ExbB proton channel family protein [Planctomycetaceae bacterium]